jgi:hypothetical protein
MVFILKNTHHEIYTKIFSNQKSGDPKKPECAKTIGAHQKKNK